MVDKVKTAVLGATGIVGQQFVRLLSRHPWFEIVALAASGEKTGQQYVEAVDWVVSQDPPEHVADMRLVKPIPDAIRDAEVVFVALPKEAAGPIEPELARAGKIVVSNASIYRMERDIPLLNPEVNYDHIRLVEVQKKRRGWQGAILKVPNCTTAILTLSLKPVHDSYGVSRIYVATMQAISGAGLRGVPGYMIVDNIIPYIKGEEEKVVNETNKILGTLSGEGVKPAGIEVYATTMRAPILDGHLEVVYAHTRGRVEGEEAARVMDEWRSIPQELGLPTAPEKPIIVHGGKDRPQPRLDRMAGEGMSVSVGRIESLGDVLRYIVLGHNTIRGAAGTGLLIAELYLKYYEKLV